MCKNLTINSTIPPPSLPIVTDIDFAYDRDCSTNQTKIEVCTKNEADLIDQFVAVFVTVTFNDTLAHSFIISFKGDGQDQSITGSITAPRTGSLSFCIRQTSFLYNSYNNLTGLAMTFTS